jgi:hypothetical protein
MSGWTPHKTAQQRRRARSPLARKVDKGNLAPSKSVRPVVCSECGHPRLSHFNEGPCWKCSCAEYTEGASDG